MCNSTFVKANLWVRKSLVNDVNCYTGYVDNLFLVVNASVGPATHF